MILLIFEGAKTEPKVMATLQYLYFSNTAEHVLCSFGTDTLTLCKTVKEHIANGYEADAFTIVRDYLHDKGDYSLDSYKSYQIESIYMFFDYDPQTEVAAGVLNNSVLDMIRLFDDAMGNGKIYISYPMMESLFCLESIPDSNYLTSCVSLSDCHHFKGWCNNSFSIARHQSEILFRTDKKHKINEVNPELRRCVLREKWDQLIILNVCKANWICNDDLSFPTRDWDISQETVFQCELSKFIIPKSSVAILNAFAIFLYEFFGKN